jgi:hypothetical protein
MAEPKNFGIGCEFYLSVALKAANDLRAALRIDEESFRRIAPQQKILADARAKKSQQTE